MKFSRALLSASSAIALTMGADTALAQPVDQNAPPQGEEAQSPSELEAAEAVAEEPGATAGASGTAEDASTPGEAGSDSIVVTGSRIRRDGYETPTPLTVSTEEELQAAAPTTIADALNQLPQFRGSSRPQTGGVSANGSVGANLLNLRGLGAQRNLVLLDGRRIVPTTTAGVTDVNVFPQELVQRVEVVTGGASAAYGSDAVAGVVNFILNTGFKGIKGELQSGISTYGDSESWKATLTFGTDFAGGRGRFVASGEYYDSKGIGPGEGQDREWARRRAGIISNVPAGSTPTRLILADNVTVSAGTFGGLITSGLLAGTAFGPGGVPYPFQYGTTRSSTFMVGGGGDRHEGNLTTGVERWSTFAHLDFDVTDTLEVFVEGNYAESLAAWDQYYNWTYTTSALTIYSQNPFIPASIQKEMNDRGIASFPLGRIYAEGEPIKAVSDGRMWRVAAGFEGELTGSWTYGGYYTHGQSVTKISNLNVLNHRNIYAAVDAVRDPAGNIVCRSTLMFGLDPGCVPLNPFGQGSPSQAAIDFYQGDEFRELTFKQDVAAFTVQGNLFSLWASPVGAAAGVEYRKESADQITDALSSSNVSFTGIRGGPAGINGQLGHFVVGNPQPLAGGYDVKEAFAEINVPVFEDAPFADLLEFNGAVRLTDYSTSGRVTTWKVGATYKPFEDLRLRATRSRDIRGPNVAELFTGSSQSIGTIFDPNTKQTESFIGSTQGNPNLDPETADTLTAGLVYQPGWLPGFAVSADYYDITIEGAIASLSAQATVDECFKGSQVACSNIEIIGGVRRVKLPQLNLQSLKTHGVDLEASYTFPLASGELSLRALVNYQGQYETTTPGAPPVDRAGEVGQSQNPKWLGAFRATYSDGPLRLFVQQRYIDKGKYNVTFVEGVGINDNTIPAVWYTDATVSWNLEDAGRDFEFFVTINNLMDKDPPLAPQQSATLQRYTNTSLYDTIGRYFTAGIRFKM